MGDDCKASFPLCKAMPRPAQHWKVKAGPWQLLTALHLQWTGQSTSKAEPHRLRSSERAGSRDQFTPPSREDSSGQSWSAGTCAPEPDTQGPQSEAQDNPTFACTSARRQGRCEGDASSQTQQLQFSTGIKQVLAEYILHPSSPRGTHCWNPLLVWRRNL